MAGVTFTEAMRAVGEQARLLQDAFDKFKIVLTNQQIEDHFDLIAATDQFMQDGGDVWGIEAVETAFLGSPVDVLDVLSELETTPTDPR